MSLAVRETCSRIFFPIGPLYCSVSSTWLTLHTRLPKPLNKRPKKLKPQIRNTYPRWQTWLGSRLRGCSGTVQFGVWTEGLFSPSDLYGQVVEGYLGFVFSVQFIYIYIYMIMMSLSLNWTCQRDKVSLIVKFGLKKDIFKKKKMIMIYF